LGRGPLPLPPSLKRSGLESGVHETKRRRDGGWSPDGSAGVHEPALGKVMGGPPPEGGAPQYFPIDALIIPH
jgi:hypothetical protein